jgi:hypothetical protein
MLRLEALEGEVERLEREFREGLTRLDSPERAR